MSVSKEELSIGIQKLNNRDISKKDLYSYVPFINQMDSMFKDYLVDFPEDSNVYLSWVVFTMQAFEDDSGAVEICSLWWERCGDPMAAVFDAYIVDDYRGGISPGLYQKLRSIRSLKDEKIGSIVSMYLGLYYSDITPNKGLDPDKAIKHLRRSVKRYSHNVHSLHLLGEIYKKRGDFTKASFYFKESVNKVVRVYSEKDIQNSTDLYDASRYIDDMILWSDCTEPKYSYLEECFIAANRAANR